MAGVRSGQTGEDRRAGHGGREQERNGGSRWASGAGRNGRGLERPVRWGRRHGREKIPTNLSTLVGYVSDFGRVYGGRLGRQTGGGTSDPFRNVKIQNGRNRGLESDLRGMYQANMDLGVLQETKLYKTYLQNRV